MNTNNSDSRTSSSNIRGLKPVVLLVDDSLDILYLHKTILELDGLRVLTASSGREALSVLEQTDSPSLILLDLRLGDMLGSEFLDLLNKSKPEILAKVPVVFLTGMDEIPESCAVGVIRKPVEIDKFVKSVRSYLRSE